MFLPDTAEIFPEWKRLVGEHQVSGLQVYDARLVAAMNVYGVKSILTFNVDDFTRYPGIQILRPESVL